MKKKFLALGLAAAMCFSLAGCAIEIPGMGGAKTASDVIEKYVEKMEAEEANYHVDLDMEFEIAAKGDGMSIELPIGMEMSMDVLGDNMHGDMNMSMSFMGQEMESNAEVYVEAGRKTISTYSYDDENGYWTVTEEDQGADLATGLSDLNTKAFEDAEMEHDSKKGTYTITQSFGDFAKYSNVYDSMEEMYGDMASMMSMDPEDFLDEWEDAEVIYVFDKDFYLTSVEITGCEFSDTMEEDGVELDVTVSLSMSFEYSDYGEIEEDDVEVPKKVKEEAVPSLTMELDEDNYHVTINGEEYGNLDEDWDYDFDEDPEDINYGGNEGMDPESGEEDIDPGFSVNPAAGNDVYGSYNGVALTGLGDSWSRTFGADGWEFDTDEDYSFIVITNDSYPGVEAYMYNENRSTTTAAQIEQDGFYGYSIDCSWKKGSTYPPMTWNGVTFGASASSVKAAYGEPSYEYNGSTYTSYEYELGNDQEITFYVYPDEGLQRVQLSYYGGL